MSIEHEMIRRANRLMPYFQLLEESAAEVLWPSRCAICDTPGTVLCLSCWRQLPFIDAYRTCPTCGAPWGIACCTECNHQTLTSRHMSHFELDGCRSVMMADKQSLPLVTVYKDRGERRLAPVIAALMKDVINPAWLTHAVVTTIPARQEALQERGFDHMESIAQLLSKDWGIPYQELLVRRKRSWFERTGDQRMLGASSRLDNMTGEFKLAAGFTAVSGQDSAIAEFSLRSSLPSRVIIVDDVMTTGATLFSAARTLHTQGVSQVFAVTLLRD